MSNNLEPGNVTLKERLQSLDKADEQIVLIAQETSNIVQILNQNNEGPDPVFSSNQSECRASLARFSSAIKSFQSIVAGELSYLQKNSSTYPHGGSVYINTMKLDLAKEACELKTEQLKNLSNSSSLK